MRCPPFLLFFLLVFLRDELVLYTAAFAVKPFTDVMVLLFAAGSDYRRTGHRVKLPNNLFGNVSAANLAGALVKPGFGRLVLRLSGNAQGKILQRLSHLLGVKILRRESVFPILFRLFRHFLSSFLIYEAAGESRSFISRPAGSPPVFLLILKHLPEHSRGIFLRFFEPPFSGFLQVYSAVRAADRVPFRKNVSAVRAFGLKTNHRHFFSSFQSL